MKIKELFRTECNQRSKYFTDIAAAFMHVQVCAAKRKSVELWAVVKTVTPCGKSVSVQELLDGVYFN